MNRVLKYARAVTKRKKVLDLYLRNILPPALGSYWSRKRNFRIDKLMRGLESREVSLGRLWPGHRPACYVSPFSHGVPADVVCQQVRNFSADRFGISKGDQDTAAFTQQFFGVPVRGRYNRLT